MLANKQALQGLRRCTVTRLIKSGLLYTHRQVGVSNLLSVDNNIAVLTVVINRENSNVDKHT